VALVGRPNVGKSTLFNRLSRTRRAIVDAVPGITRDRIEAPVEWRGRHFLLVDTGGIDVDDRTGIGKQVVEQARRAVAGSDVIVLVADAREGLHPLDRDVARLLRPRAGAVIVVGNKVDTPGQAPAAGDLHALGLEPVVATSAEQGQGVDALLDAILERLPEAPTALPQEDATRVAIVGRPNVGKSSLVNRLLGEERLVVSESPGTTRDAVDVRVVADGHAFVLVDTAGLRRKGTDRARVEHVARQQAEGALERADVAVLMLDAVEGPTHQDAVIAGLAASSGTGLVILLNKWDLVRDQEARYKTLVAAVRERMKFASWAPVLTISALTGERVAKVLREAHRVATSRARRVPTAELNEVVRRAIHEHQPPQAGRGRSFGVKYLTQVGTCPPTFVAFTVGGMPHFTWRRYLENRLRDELGFEGTPLRVRYRSGKGRRSAARRDEEHELTS
jgi:GTP-binding protein